MSTGTLRSRTSFLLFLCGFAVSVASPGPVARGTTQETANDSARSENSFESDVTTVLEAGAEARAAAYDILGDRPFQAVLMSGQRVVMTASSTGTSPFTDVPIASISKLVTSMSVMRLIETGQLTLETPIGDVLSPVIVPPAWRTVTVAQLLSHTSGFSADRDRWFNDTYSSCFDAFRRTVQRDLPAGQGYEYSNTNFCALSLEIGSIVTPSYTSAANRLVFRPLGIGRKIMDPEYAHLAGAGGWRMSAIDTARIVAALDPSARSSPLSAATRSQMIQQTTYNYGLGVWIWDAETYGHSGSLYRARNIAVRLPSGRSVVIMTQATFPESGLDLLPLARRIDAAYEARCTRGPCEFRGLDPFADVPSGLIGRAHV